MVTSISPALPIISARANLLLSTSLLLEKKNGTKTNESMALYTDCDLRCVVMVTVTIITDTHSGIFT